MFKTAPDVCWPIYVSSTSFVIRPTRITSRFRSVYSVETIFGQKNKRMTTGRGHQSSRRALVFTTRVGVGTVLKYGQTRTPICRAARAVRERTNNSRTKKLYSRRRPSHHDNRRHLTSTIATISRRYIRVMTIVLTCFVDNTPGRRTGY